MPTYTDELDMAVMPIAVVMVLFATIGITVTEMTDVMVASVDVAPLSVEEAVAME